MLLQHYALTKQALAQWHATNLCLTMQFHKIRSSEQSSFAWNYLFCVYFVFPVSLSKIVNCSVIATRPWRPWPPWILKYSAKRLFFSFEWGKIKLHHFWPPWKNLGKSSSAPPHWKKPFDAHVPDICGLPPFCLICWNCWATIILAQCAI